MHDEEVEVVDPPIPKLLLADGLHALLVVERVPELGDDEEVFTLDETFLDRTGYTLTAFHFIAVIWKGS